MLKVNKPKMIWGKGKGESRKWEGWRRGLGVSGGGVSSFFHVKS